MEDQEIVDSDSYLLAHLRNMCEVVMKTIGNYEHLLETNSSEDLRSKIFDLISSVEKKCQAFKQSSEQLYQNLNSQKERRNSERSSPSNADFHRPLSQIYKNELYNSEGFNFLQNDIKQESDEIGGVRICDQNENHAEMENKNSSTNISTFLNQTYKGSRILNEKKFGKNICTLTENPEKNAEKNNPDSNTNLFRFPREKFLDHPRVSISEERFGESMSSTSNHLINNTEEINSNVNTTISESSRRHCKGSTSGVRSHEKFEQTMSAIKNGKLISNQENICNDLRSEVKEDEGQIRREKEDGYLNTDQLIEQLNEFINCSSKDKSAVLRKSDDDNLFLPLSSTSKIRYKKRKNKILVKKNCPIGYDVTNFNSHVTSSTHTNRTPIHKFYTSSPPTDFETNCCENGEVSDNQQGMNASQYIPSKAKFDEKHRNDSSENFKEELISKDSEKQSYIQDKMCKDHPEFQAPRINNAEEVISRNNIEKTSSLQNIVQDMCQEDTRGGLLELLTPLSQLFDDDSTILSLDNTHVHENNIENNKDNFPVQNLPYTSQDNTVVDISTSESSFDLSNFNDSKSNSSTIYSYTEHEVQDALKELDLMPSSSQLSPWSTCSLDSILDSEVSIDSKHDSFYECRNESSQSFNYTDDQLSNEDFGDDKSGTDSFSNDPNKAACSENFINEPDLVEIYNNQHKIKDCSVIVQRLPSFEYPKHISGDNFHKDQQTTYHIRAKDEDEINRLCQMNSLDEKKSQNSVDLNAMDKMREKNTSLMDSSLNESGELTIGDCLIDEHNELESIEANIHLADIVCKTIEYVDDLDGSDVESTGEIYRTKNPNLKSSTKRSKTKSNNISAVSKDSYSRKDPLVTGRLSINENPMPKKTTENGLKIEYSHCTNKAKVEQSSGKLHSETKASSPIQYAQGSGEKCQSNPKTWRKNIKPVLTYQELTEATKWAEKEEKQRCLRIQQRQQLLSSQLNEEDVFILDRTKAGEAIEVDPLLNRKLYPHQREGVKFMWQSCYESVERLQHFSGVGCILAHCMGLGKTFQVFTLLHTLFSHPITNMKHCLIICPVSTVIVWKKEIESGLELSQKKIDITLEYLDGTDNRVTKCVKITRWQKKSGIILMGYEIFVQLIYGNFIDEKIKKELSEALLDPGPDLVICDEGHLLKNRKAKRTQALSKIRTRRRIILSGTPMQNNLGEYYYMVNFVNPNILGTFQEYSDRFVDPITNGQYSSSTKEEIILMKKKIHVLHGLLRNTIQRFEVSELNKYLKPIKNYTIFIKMHQLQILLYQYFIQRAEHFITSSGQSINIFNDMNVAKYICSHPHLLSIMEEQIKLKKNRRDLLLNGEENVLKVRCIEKDWWKEFCSENDICNIDSGPKLKLTLAIIEEAEKLGEKILIFTSSLIELESLEYFLKKDGTSCSKEWRCELDYFRMDGSVQPTKRAKMCSCFNDPENKRLRVLLISYKVGGVGLSLTAANRVVILGSVFNPVHDTQSIYRCYRFGQTKTVYVYRLISLGTMEEKIYRRCVSKLALACRVVDKQQIGRHYDLSDMKKLYKNDVKLYIPKKFLSRPDDNLLATLISKFYFIHDYVDHQGLLENKPEDDLNDEEKQRAWEEFRRECENLPSSQPGLIETNAEEIITNTLSSDLTLNTTLSDINKPNSQTPTNFYNSSHRKVILPSSQCVQLERNQHMSSDDTNSVRVKNMVQSMQIQNQLTSLNTQHKFSKKQNDNLNTSNDKNKSFPEHNVFHKNEEKQVSSGKKSSSSVVNIKNNVKNANKVNAIHNEKLKKNNKFPRKESEISKKIPLLSVEKSPYATTSSKSKTNFDISRTSSKRSYPYTSDEIQHSPLDLSKKNKKNETSKSSYKQVMNKQSYKKSESSRTKHRKNNKSVPYCIQKQKHLSDAVRIRKEKLKKSRSSLSKSTDKTDKIKKKQTNKLLTGKLSSLYSKWMNESHNNTNRVSESNPTIVPSTSNFNEKLSMI